MFAFDGSKQLQRPDRPWHSARLGSAQFKDGHAVEEVIPDDSGSGLIIAQNNAQPLSESGSNVVALSQ